jgi:hypothetical protein
MPASREQQQLMKRWYDHTGFEFIGANKVEKTDPQGFIRLWHKNVEWLQDVTNEVAGFISEYVLKNIDSGGSDKQKPAMPGKEK